MRPATRHWRSCSRPPGAARRRWRRCCSISELIPDRFEYRQGATYVDSPIADLLEAGAGVCQDFVHLGLCLLRHHGIAARYVSGYLFAARRGRRQRVDRGRHPRLARGALPALDGGEPVVGRRRPHQPRARRRDPREDRPRPPLRRRPPIKGVYRGAATADARRQRHDDPPGGHRPGFDRPVLRRRRRRPELFVDSISPSPPSGRSLPTAMKARPSAACKSAHNMRCHPDQVPVFEV